MALFGKKDKNPAPPSAAPPRVRQLPPREALCGVCNARRPFSRCWVRTEAMIQCPNCGLAFDSPARLYRLLQPACPQCGEFLEQPGFDYGLCDNCGSKHEIVAGTKPILLPSKAQREAMDKRGRAWRPE
ncbi:MAG: hypothetical protein GWP08_19640 [Nitrospiraceae bacterium]|nr:hypothetical protein [Nitrospiraceae bacterium]